MIAHVVIVALRVADQSEPSPSIFWATRSPMNMIDPPAARFVLHGCVCRRSANAERSRRGEKEERRVVIHVDISMSSVYDAEYAIRAAAGASALARGRRRACGTFFAHMQYMHTLALCTYLRTVRTYIYTYDYMIFFSLAQLSICRRGVGVALENCP